MPAVLPPALEALLRMEGRQYPNAAEMEMIGMPMGVPFSNQNPGSGYRNVPSGTLNALTTMLSGLGAPMGYDQPAPPPDPRTLVMRNTVSPGAPMEPVAQGNPSVAYAAMAPMGQESSVAAQLIQQLGGEAPSQQDIWKRQAQYLKQGGGVGDQEKYAAWKRGMAGDEKSRRDLVNQRAMQVAQARTNRRSGMDPRTAALLAALGDDAGGLGQVVLGNALSPGFGAKAYELGVEERVRDKANEAAIERQQIESGVGGATGTSAPTTPEKQAEASKSAIATAIRSGDQAAIASAATNESRAAIAQARKKGLSGSDVIDYAINELHTKHGLSIKQAQSAAEAATGNQPGAFKERKGTPKKSDGLVISDKSINQALGDKINEWGLTDPLTSFYKAIGWLE